MRTCLGTEREGEENGNGAENGEDSYRPAVPPCVRGPRGVGTRVGPRIIRAQAQLLAGLCDFRRDVDSFAAEVADVLDELICGPENAEDARADP